MEAELMTTLPEATKTVFGKRDAKQASAATDATIAHEFAHEFAMELGSIRFRNHETLTARGWLAHRTSWPKDRHVKYGVTIPYGGDRVLVAAAPARDRL
jgi:hypothetical protein